MWVLFVVAAAAACISNVLNSYNNKLHMQKMKNNAKLNVEVWSPKTRQQRMTALPKRYMNEAILNGSLDDGDVVMLLLFSSS